MKRARIVKLELSKDEVYLLKEIVDNEVVNYSVYSKKRNADNDLKKYFEKLKVINRQLEEKLSYAGGV